MRILIDGYNLIRTIPELARSDRLDLEEGRLLLCKELSVYRAGRGHRITVVFDGMGSYHPGDQREKAGGINVIFSRQGRSADDVIASMCAEGRVDLLVTGDQDLRRSAEGAGVVVAWPDFFWDRVQWERIRRFKGEEIEDDDEERIFRRPGKRYSRAKRRENNLLSRL